MSIQEMSDYVYEHTEARNPDGSTNVNIHSYRRTGNTVEVFFRDHTLREKSEVMAWPPEDSPRYKLVRICRQTVGGFEYVSLLKDGETEVKADPDSWEIIARPPLFRFIIGHVPEFGLLHLREKVFIAVVFAVTLSVLIMSATASIFAVSAFLLALAVVSLYLIYYNERYNRSKP